MQDFFISLLLGIVEGVTEFLPVSSTAHIRLVQQLFNLPLDDPFWKMYAIVIQLGAVMCLPVYFYGRLRRYLHTFPRGEHGGGNVLRHPITLVLVAFVCTAGPVFLLKKIVSHNLESLNVIGAALLIGGAVMWAVDVTFTRPTTDRVDSMNIIQAIWIGLIQVLSAVFPGTSRSMATIAAGQTAGLSRATALEFSFLVSIPTMFVATLYDLLKAIFPGKDAAGVGLAPVQMTVHNWAVLGLGFIVSFFVALIVVSWFMAWVRRRGFVPFAIYRIILGIVVLLYARHLATNVLTLSSATAPG